jgi:uracil-DNA glycosylase
MNTWQKFITEEQSKDYFKTLNSFVNEQRNSELPVYPPEKDVFNAFKLTLFEDIKCCIVGQDPYFLEGLAHGLSFSVEKGVKIPRSLSNIYKELSSDILRFEKPEHGNLEEWAKKGVFLLNTVLTVDKDNAGSHRKKGWEIFTAQAIKKINDEHKNVVFLAWGKDAHKVCQNIDSTKHTVIKTSHPSPLGASKSGKDFDSFIGSRCFSKANFNLIKSDRLPIDWTIT